MAKCIICHRNTEEGLQPLNLDKKICVCGRLLTPRMVKRIKFWMCRRKKRYKEIIAEEKSHKYSIEKQITTHRYKCPFCPGHHVGKINDILKDQYAA